MFLVDVDVTEISFQEGVAQHLVTNIHSSARIQQDLELWRRFKEYDQKSAEEPFLPVLSRKQKQHLKKPILVSLPQPVQRVITLHLINDIGLFVGLVIPKPKA